MVHYFDVICCGISKCMHISLFSLADSNIPWLSWVKDNPEKIPRKNLTTTPFSYINDAFVNLNLWLPESVYDKVLWGDSTFWVCGRNPMMWPLKCKLSACTYTWCYLFFSIWESETVTFGWNFLLAKFGSEKVEWSLSPYNLPLSKGTSYCQWHFSPGFAVPWDFAFSARSGIKSLFTRINSTSHTALSSAQAIYSCLFF